jgi:tetratricopeptide (TPR) repeat protein
VIAASAYAQVDTSTLHAVSAALEAHQYQQALDLASSDLQRWPNDARLWTLQGIAQSELGQNSSAAASFSRALALGPDYLPALEGAAQVQYFAGSLSAVPLLKRILSVRPTDQTAHAMLAAMAYKQGDCQSAAEHFALAARAISSQPAALDQYAACLAVLKRPDDAISVLRSLVGLQPTDRSARVKLAAIQFSGQHATDAIQTLTPLLGSTKPDPDALDLASAAYEAVGDTPQAVETLRRAIVLSPRTINYYLDFVDLCLAHSSFEVGVQMVNAGLRLLPGAASLYVARGVLLVQLAKYDQAESDFEIAQQLDPNQALGSSAKALADIQQNNLDRALKIVQSQLRQKPNDAFLHYLLAQILVRRGVSDGSPEMQEAFAAAQKAVGLNPDLAVAHDVLARLYLDSGRVTLAAQQSRLALRADPSDRSALNVLILALRRGGKTDAIPPLLKRYASLREQAAKQEARDRRFRLVAPGQSAFASTGKM